MSKPLRLILAAIVVAGVALWLFKPDLFSPYLGASSSGGAAPASESGG